MKTRYFFVAALLSTTLTTLAHAQTSQTKRLGILGGLAGAGIGAAIGEDDGDAVPGALIGGTIGLITGAAVGDSIDAQNARRQAFYEARQRQAARAVTLGDVVSMTQAGLSDPVIVGHIHANGVAGPLTTADLIVLKQNGVSDQVINALQRSPQGAVIAHPAPVVVEQYYHRPYACPRPVRTYHYHARHPGHHHHYHRPVRHGYHWGFRFH